MRKYLLLWLLRAAIKLVDWGGYCVDVTPDLGETWFTIDDRDVGISDTFDPDPIYDDGRKDTLGEQA